MTVYLKLSKRFYTLLFCLVGTVYLVLKCYYSHGYIFGGIALVLFVICITTLITMLRFIFYKKPIFTVNEVFIFDYFNNIQYNWDDIKEVIATDDYLDIQLCEPEKYFKMIKSPFGRFMTKIYQGIFKIKSLYTIDINLLDIEKGKNKEFLDKLNEYSLATS